MMPRLTPDKLNGVEILRPVAKRGDSTPFLASSSVFFKPTVEVKHNILSFEEMAGRMADHITRQKAMTKTELAHTLYNFARAVAQNEALKNG